VASASTDQELETAFSSLAKLQAGALAIGGDPYFNSRGEQLGELSIRHAMPAIYQFRTFIEGGGLASYGTDLAEAYFQSGRYVGRVLKGEKPADLGWKQEAPTSTRRRMEPRLGGGPSFPGRRQLDC
jgi:putative ABC transport system substrate-binding protein